MDYDELNLYEVAGLIARAADDGFLYAKLVNGDLCRLFLSKAENGRITFDAEPIGEE